MSHISEGCKVKFILSLPLLHSTSSLCVTSVDTCFFLNIQKLLCKVGGLGQVQGGFFKKQLNVLFGILFFPTW